MNFYSLAELSEEQAALVERVFLGLLEEASEVADAVGHSEEYEGKDVGTAGYLAAVAAERIGPAIEECLRALLEWRNGVES